MGLSRTLPLVVRGQTLQVGDCNTGGLNGASGGGTINGQIINRLGLPRNFRHASPFLTGSGFSTTEANNKITVLVKMQHGDSSGGGDMADYTTHSQPDDVVHGASARTTPMAGWTTEINTIYTRPAGYDIVPAKQFIRSVATVTLPGVTTSTVAASLVDTHVSMVLYGADEEPIPVTGKHLLQNLFTSATATAT